MIDLTNIKSPGWQRIIAELTSAAPDDRAFLERILRIMAQVTAARQAILFVPEMREGDAVEARPISVWPLAPDGAAQTIENEEGTKTSARAALESGQSRVFGLESSNLYYDDTSRQGCVLAIPLGSPRTGATPGAAGTGEAGAPAVITLLVEPRSKEAVRTTLAMAEVIAGYLHGHTARQGLRRANAASAALDLAARLISSINTAPNFRGAAIQLANDISREFSVDRAAIGWVREDTVRVEAISDTEHFDRRMAMVQRLQGAMDECLDQEQPIVFPQPSARPGESPTEADALLSQAIVHAHRELAAGDSRIRVCSVPLRTNDGVIGVVTIESAGVAVPGASSPGADGDFTLDRVELLQAAFDLVAPVLAIKRSDDRNLALRAWASTLNSTRWLVGPTHTAWKLAGLLALAAVVFVALYTTTYRVGATAVLQPTTKRIVSAPFDGQIARIGEGASKGRTVAAGDVLIELDDTEWRLRMADAKAQLYQESLKSAAARAEGKTAESQKADAAARSAQAQINLINERVSRSVIRAPIAGVVIDGLEARERIGSTIKLGDPLFVIAPENDMLVVARVDERDIALVQLANDRAKADGKAGAEGAIATKADPSNRHRFVIETIVPMANAEEGKNTFEVRGRLLDPVPGMRPGTEGLARVDTERHSLLWIGTRRILDTVRLWIW